MSRPVLALVVLSCCLAAAMAAIDCVRARAVADHLHGDCDFARACLSFLEVDREQGKPAPTPAAAVGLAANSGFDANEGFASNDGVLSGNDAFRGNDGFISEESSHDDSNDGFFGNDGFVGNDGFSGNDQGTDGSSNDGFVGNEGFVGNDGFTDNDQGTDGSSNDEFIGNEGFVGNVGFGGNNGFAANEGFSTDDGVVARSVQPRQLFDDVSSFVQDVFTMFASGIQSVLQSFDSDPLVQPDEDGQHDPNVIVVFHPVDICKALIECGEFSPPTGSFATCMPDGQRVEEPPCSEHWIGDGVCDEQCVKFDNDGGDCDDVTA